VKNFSKGKSQKSRSFRWRLKQRYIKNIIKSDKHPCTYCKIILTKDQMTIDHILPKSKGGTDDYNNLTISCIACNKEKKDKVIC